jgi:hypothetical protein
MAGTAARPSEMVAASRDCTTNHRNRVNPFHRKRHSLLPDFPDATSASQAIISRVHSHFNLAHCGVANDKSTVSIDCEDYDGVAISFDNEYASILKVMFQVGWLNSLAQF